MQVTNEEEFMRFVEIYRERYEKIVWYEGIGDDGAGPGWMIYVGGKILGHFDREEIELAEAFVKIVFGPDVPAKFVLLAAFYEASSSYTPGYTPER